MERRYGFGHLHFITCSCYRRTPLLDTAKARDAFLESLIQVRARFDFALVGYVVMPEHVHLLMSEPNSGDPSLVMKSLKEQVSRRLCSTRDGDHFWQRRFYDFNVWSERKWNEKLNYIHHNPVKRGLVEQARDWRWSSYSYLLARREEYLSAQSGTAL